MSNNPKVAVGIDLGTTYTCAGIMYQGKVKIITNAEGQLTTPSMVAFTDCDRLVGGVAKNQIVLNAINTVFGKLIAAYNKITSKYCDALSF